jgi:Domain of unknown function (DUF5615)
MSVYHALKSSETHAAHDGMKFLVDAHLPRRLAHRLRAWGHEAIHTLDCPRGNRTPDEEAEGAIALP